MLILTYNKPLLMTSVFNNDTKVIDCQWKFNQSFEVGDLLGVNSKKDIPMCAEITLYPIGNVEEIKTEFIRFIIPIESETINALDLNDALTSAKLLLNSIVIKTVSTLSGYLKRHPVPNDISFVEAVGFLNSRSINALTNQQLMSGGVVETYDILLTHVRHGGGLKGQVLQ